MAAPSAAPLRAVATGSVDASPCAPEMAAHTFASAEDTAEGVVEHEPRASAAAVTVVARAAIVRLFTSNAFRRGALLPITVAAAPGWRPSGRHTSPH